MGKVNWSLVEADFLATGLSYSRLAKKHGLSLSAVKKRAASGHWQDRLRELRAREEAVEEPAVEILQPEELALETRQARRMRLQDAADRIMEKINRALEELEPDNTYALSTLVRALKDLRELQGLQKDALDLAEQQARIAKLRSGIRDMDSESGGGVLLIPAVDEAMRPPEESAPLPEEHEKGGLSLEHEPDD